MFERFTREARAVVVRATEDARRRTHDHIGTEHLLLGLLAPDAGSTSRLLLDVGVDGERVDVAVRRLNPPSGGFFSDAEADALRAVGIHVDAVLERMEQTFGPDAVRAQPSPRRGPFRRSRAGGRSRFTPRARKVLELALREAIHCHDDHIGAEHILLGLLREGRGSAVTILLESGVDLDALRRTTMAALRKAA
jgi:ATP-dependent Clp protease ATP-binding subunit ClpA